MIRQFWLDECDKEPGWSWRLGRQTARDREWALAVGEPLADRHAVIMLAGLQTILPLRLLLGGATGLLFASLREVCAARDLARVGFPVYPPSDDRAFSGAGVPGVSVGFQDHAGAHRMWVKGLSRVCSEPSTRPKTR